MSSKARLHAVFLGVAVCVGILSATSVTTTGASATEVFLPAAIGGAAAAGGCTRLCISCFGTNFRMPHNRLSFT